MEQVKGIVVEARPILGERGQVVLVLVTKILAGVSAGVQPDVEKGLQFFLQQRTGELFAQHGRETQGHSGRDPALAQSPQGAQQREVTLDDGFAQPVAAVRPAAMPQNERLVRV